MVKPIYEFVLWDNCLNTCSFCWQKKHDYKPLCPAQKELARKCVAKALDDKETYVQGSHVLLIGGELFDMRDSNNVISHLFDLVLGKMLFREIDLLYFNTNLLRTNEPLLAHILTKFKTHNLFNRLKFTTSHDIVGRFHESKFPYDDEGTEREWLSRVKWLRYEFPDLKITVNSILTAPLCERILQGKFNPVTEFKKYGCYTAMLPYVPVDESLVPTRQQVFSALSKIETLEPGYLAPYIRLLDANQPRIVMKFDGQKFVPKSADTAKCGHCENLSMYSTGKTCFVCDLKTVFSDLL